MKETNGSGRPLAYIQNAAQDEPEEWTMQLKWIGMEGMDAVASDRSVAA